MQIILAPGSADFSPTSFCGGEATALAAIGISNAAATKKRIMVESLAYLGAVPPRLVADQTTVRKG
ncbi:hypothetical protein [Sphingomonas sp. LR55]|uniref:hypothetical protein n=1 Tax=Sphingomonas sp. LR55 TaxID=3050231 RepID=UPI002FE429AE